jgi:alpha-ketoglutarate-dependent taurine dioxygenase
LTPAVGAEVTGVDLAGIDDAEFVHVERARHQYGALLFRGQQPTDDEFLTFSRRSENSILHPSRSMAD